MLDRDMQKVSFAIARRLKM